MAAEAEIVMHRVADRPLAGFFAQMKNGDAAVLGVVDQTQRLGFRQRHRARGGVGIGLKRVVARCRHGRRATGNGWLAGFAHRAARRGAARLRGTTSEVEAVHFADHGIAGDAHAQAPSNLAGAQSVGPELL